MENKKEKNIEDIILSKFSVPFSNYKMNFIIKIEKSTLYLYQCFFFFYKYEYICQNLYTPYI